MLAWTLTRPESHMRAMLAGVADSASTSSLIAVSLMSAGGSQALEWESERSRHGEAARSWLRTKGNSIEGGTSEVQLNVIAKRILELPGA